MYRPAGKPKSNQGIFRAAKRLLESPSDLASNRPSLCVEKTLQIVSRFAVGVKLIREDLGPQCPVFEDVFLILPVIGSERSSMPYLKLRYKPPAVRFAEPTIAKSVSAI